MRYVMEDSKEIIYYQENEKLIFVNPYTFSLPSKLTIQNLALNFINFLHE